MSVNTILSAWDAGRPIMLPRVDEGPSWAQAVYIFALELLRDGRDRTAPPDRVELRTIQRLGFPIRPEQIAQGRAVAAMVRTGWPTRAADAVEVRRDFPSAPAPPPTAPDFSPRALTPGTDYPRRPRGRGPGADLAKAQAGGYIGEALGE